MKDQLQFQVRKARIYKDMYRPAPSLTRFLVTLLSVLINGRSQVGYPDHYIHRRRA
jgi:hypothetical protein